MFYVKVMQVQLLVDNRSTILYFCLFRFKMLTAPCWILAVFKHLLVTLETPPCFLPLAHTLRLPDAFQFLTTWEKTSISLGNGLPLLNKLCTSLWHFYLKLSMFFSGFRVFVLVIPLYRFFSCNIVLFNWRFVYFYRFLLYLFSCAVLLNRDTCAVRKYLWNNNNNNN